MIKSCSWLGRVVGWRAFRCSAVRAIATRAPRVSRLIFPSHAAWLPCSPGPSFAAARQVTPWCRPYPSPTRTPASPLNRAQGRRRSTRIQAPAATQTLYVVATLEVSSVCLIVPFVPLVALVKGSPRSSLTSVRPTARHRRRTHRLPWGNSPPRRTCRLRAEDAPREFRRSCPLAASFVERTGWYLNNSA